MGVPLWLLRKVYRRGSLRREAGQRFSLTLQNVLGDATIVAPPRFVINGVQHDPADVESPLDLTAISSADPHAFRKGDVLEFTFSGHLLRGANRIHVVVETDEYGSLEVFVEDKAHDEEE